MELGMATCEPHTSVPHTSAPHSLHPNCPSFSPGPLWSSEHALHSSLQRRWTGDSCRHVMATLLPSSSPCVIHPNSRPCPKDVGAQGAAVSQLSLEITLLELGGRPWALLLRPGLGWTVRPFPPRFYHQERNSYW